MQDETEVRAQIAAQYRAVAYLARAIADVHDQLTPAIKRGSCDGIASIQGPRSAAIMEILGDILNGMDAVDEEDAVLDHVFEKAHELYPNARTEYMGEQA